MCDGSACRSVWRSKRVVRNIAALFLFLMVGSASAGIAPAAVAAAPTQSPAAGVVPMVFTFAIISAERGAKVLHGLFPHAAVRIERGSNSVVVIAPQATIDAMRGVVTGIDVRNPTDSSVEAVTLHVVQQKDLVARLQPLFPQARFRVAPNRTVLVSAGPQVMAQIKAVVAAIDAAPPSPTPRPTYPSTAVRVLQADAVRIARAVARTQPNVRVSVSGTNVLLSGPPDDVAAAKAVISQLDVPSRDIRYSEIYRFHYVDARSVARLFEKSFSNVEINVDKDLNALTVLATASMQQRVAYASSQLDAPPNAPQSAGGSGPSGGAVQSEVVVLRSAVPAIGGAASTSASDIAQSVTQALSTSASDLKITVHPNSTRLILTGSTYSLRLAKELITQLDVAEPLVELDTEVYEIDEGVQKQLGFRFPTAALSTTYSETTPTANANGVTPPLTGFQALTRTPLTLSAQLDFLVSTNKAKILEDPRITTFSGRTASLRAGETVNILTTTGGGTGTVATTQIQSFQTGVTLDITPVVNTGRYVTLTLHPSVNTEAGISAAGVPNIQTRDTTTTVGLRDGETLVVGGLIEDSNSRTVQKIPFLGDLPLIGRFFQDVGISRTRNELVVTVTPHIIRNGVIPTTLDPIEPNDTPTSNSLGDRSGIGESAESSAAPLIKPPTSAPLPSIPSSATLPPPPSPSSALPTSTARRITNVPAADGQTVAPPLATPAPSAQPPTASPLPGPAPQPSAFAQTNVYTFGSAPANNYADASQPPQIFFAQVQPSVVKNGQPMSIAAITTTNVSNLSFGVSADSAQVSLGNAGAGKWQSTFNFSTAGIASTKGNISMVLTATTPIGARTSINIPLALASQ